MTERSQPCVGWDEDLSAFLDAELEPARRSEVAAHLASCPRCSERVEALRAVDAKLAAIPLPEISDRLAPPRPEAEPAPRLRRTSSPGSRPRTAPHRDPAPRRAAWKTHTLTRIATAAAIALSLYWVLAPGREPISKRGGEAPPIARVPGGASEAVAPPRAPDSGSVASEATAVAVTEPASAPDVATPLDAASDEELALAFELETVENLDVIANLELLERLLALEEGRG
jgi:anti-sigma factor RsiW